MLLPLKPICEKKNVRKDGTSIIYIQYCYSPENRTNLNTQIAIPPQFWDRRKLCVSNKLPTEFGKPQELNDKLDSLFRIAEDLVKYATQNSIAEKGAFVKKLFHPDFDL